MDHLGQQQAFASSLAEATRRRVLNVVRRVGELRDIVNSRHMHMTNKQVLWLQDEKAD